MFYVSNFLIIIRELFFKKDQKWFDSSLLGVSLNIPIFSSLSRSSRTQQAKIELEKERKIAELDRLKATEEEKANIIAFYDGKITDAKDKNEEKWRIRTFGDSDFAGDKD